MSLRSWFGRLFRDSPVGSAPSNTRTLAERGNPEAQCSLGVQCCGGQGTASDTAQAAMWFRRAAEQDHPLAQLKLGLLLATGDGVARDDAAALGWIRKAAEGGDSSAQFNLGSRCHRRSVDPLDTDRVNARIEAYKWFRIAAGQGYQGAEAACERVALEMSLEHVADANQQICNFVPRPQPVNAALAV